MRARLIIVLLVPLTCILLALGGAYAWSLSRSVQQEFANQQLSDLSYFTTSARQALRSGNATAIEAQMVRYSELYSADIAVIDRIGTVWAASGPEAEVLDDDDLELVRLSLSGRRSEVTQSAMPWSPADSVMVEPVFEDGSVIGAVMISASAEGPRGHVATQWSWLVAASLLVVLLLLFAVWRLATWVLQPMRRVDDAMAAIEHGEMDARIDDDTGPPEMQHMIRVFNQMAGEIEGVVSRQQEFVLNASHELRNPLGALLLRVEYLATGLDESWSSDVEKTREEGRRMARILDTLLLVARTRKVDTQFAMVNLSEIVSARVEEWRPIADRAEVRLAPSVPAQLTSFTDRTAVESAFDAVLDNSLKFAPRGSVVEISLRGDDGATLSVRDHGPGMNPEDLLRATDRFWRSPRDQNVPGSGLGLAIATDLLQSMNGSIKIENADGGGLIVHLRLPGGGA